MLEDGVWGDYIMLHLISAMWDIRITVVRGDSCSEIRIRHNVLLINSGLAVLFNGFGLAGHYSAITRVVQTKLKCTQIAKAASFDYAVDINEFKRNFHRLGHNEVIVKADRLATLVAKETEFDQRK